MNAKLGPQVPGAVLCAFAEMHMGRKRVIVRPHENGVALQLLAGDLLVGEQSWHENQSSRTSHRVAAVEAFVAGAGSHRDGAADVAGGGVLLHFYALLAQRVGDDEAGAGGGIIGVEFGLDFEAGFGS